MFVVFVRLWGLAAIVARQYHIGLLRGAHLWELVLYETDMFAVVQFHPANDHLPPTVDRALRAIIVTPDLHRVHHTRYQPETDLNYSSLFSFWDPIGQFFPCAKTPRQSSSDCTDGTPRKTSASWVCCGPH